MPTPAEFAVVGVNPQQAKADAKRYAKQFKKHVENFNSHFRVIITASMIHITDHGNDVWNCPFNVESAKNLLLLSKLSENSGPAILKAITDNNDVLKNYLAIPGDYKSSPTPEDLYP